MSLENSIKQLCGKTPRFYAKRHKNLDEVTKMTCQLLESSFIESHNQGAVPVKGRPMHEVSHNPRLRKVRENGCTTMGCSVGCVS